MTSDSYKIEIETRKTCILLGGNKKEVYYDGNLDVIRKYPVIGVLASSNAPGPVIWETYRFFYALRNEKLTIAGGWHSPLEKGILDGLLEGKVNVAFFLAKGLKSRGVKQKLAMFDKTSRGLMITPFSDEVTKIDRKKGPRLRNELLASASDILLIPYIRSNGMLARMLKTNKSFQKKTFTLDHPENDSFTLITQRVKVSNLSALLKAAQNAFTERIS